MERITIWSMRNPNLRNWIFLGLVQADIVNASMNVLQRSTVLLVSAVAVCIAGLFIGIILRKNRVNLKRKDTEILYRDEIVSKAVNECR